MNDKLREALEKLEAAFCGCDMMRGYTCGIHAHIIAIENAALAAPDPGQVQGTDDEIFSLACKLVDTASGDRKCYWLPVLSQLCEAVRKRDREIAASAQPAAKK